MKTWTILAILSLIISLISLILILVNSYKLISIERENTAIEQTLQSISIEQKSTAIQTNLIEKRAISIETTISEWRLE